VPFSDQVCLPDSIWKRSGQNPDWLTPPPQGVDANGTPIRWEGCVGSREKPLVARIDQATTAPWPAVERTKNTPLNLNGRWFYSNANDTRPMISLSRDTATLKATVNRLTANGWTYVPSGMIWGWNTLTPEAPFTEASQRGDARKVLLLFSDSENTRRTTTAPRGAASFGKTTTGNAQSNEEMLETCQNAKRDGIEVIVFWYQMRNSSKDYVDKLKQCASQPDYFVEADPKVRGNLAQRFGLVKNLLHEELRLSQ
jgi:hypothetical protein